VAPEDIRDDPYLARYVQGWGREGDLGVIGETGGDLVGAAWVRLLVGDEQNDIAFVDAETPELAIAVLPGHEGGGKGTTLMRALIARSRPVYPGIVLTVREVNPAVRFYERLGFETVDRVVNRVATASLKMLLRF
jgi:ribosomal protein S18 acetylase RimI-like enzyme